MSLRELVWMAKGRRQLMGELVAWEIRWVREAVWADKLPPLEDLNPYRERTAKSEDMERLEEWQAGRRWSAMFGTKG